MQRIDNTGNHKKVKSAIERSEIRFYASPEEQERERLKEAINRTDTEKFYYLMNLMKMQQVIKKGNIINSKG